MTTNGDGPKLWSETRKRLLETARNLGDVYLAGAKYIDASFKYASVVALVASVVLYAFSFSQSEPTLKGTQQSGPTPEAVSLECITIQSIAEAYTRLRADSFGAKREIFAAEFKGRRICGQGWPAIVEATIDVAGGAMQTVVVSDPVDASLKLQFETAVTYRRQSGDLVYFTVIFDEFTEGERIVGRQGTTIAREAPPKLAPKSRRKPMESQPALADSRNADQPTFNLFKPDTWFSDGTDRSKVGRDRYTRD